MALLRVTQTKSTIGGLRNQRESLRTLGLKRVGDQRVVEDTQQNKGLINVVAHMVIVEEVEAE